MKNESLQAKEVREWRRQTNGDAGRRTQASVGKDRKDQPCDFGVRGAIRGNGIHRTSQRRTAEPGVSESAAPDVKIDMHAKIAEYGDVRSRLKEAASDRAFVSGWTHNFYRYPARFSPTFAAAAIKALSQPDDIILDPYMGGGTAIIEALAAGRRAVGNDLNSLATFVTRVKTTPLAPREVKAIRRWAQDTVPLLSYRSPKQDLIGHMAPEKMKNLDLPRARFIKKLITGALSTITTLPTRSSQDFVRCVVLRTGQWALDGRRTHTALHEFRNHLREWCFQMLEQLGLFQSKIRSHSNWSTGVCLLSHGNATELNKLPIFARERKKAALVITSPPYPGVHVLYHRWQVDGRRESPAPYWIINGKDGQTESYYTFGQHRQRTIAPYFITSLRTLKSIRRCVKRGGFMVQLVAFNNPQYQLGRYLSNMTAAGFEEVALTNPGEIQGEERIWREVPNRKWHAVTKGRTHSSREVVLVHIAV